MGGVGKSRLDRLRADPLVGRFFKAAGLSLILRLAWAVANYAGVVLLARWLAPADYGVYGFVMSGVMFLSVVCGLGGQSTLIRFIGQYRSEGRPDLAAGVIRWFLRRTMFWSTLVAIAGAVGSYAAAAMSLVDDPRPYAIGFAILPGFTIIDSQLGIARSYGAVFAALAPKDVIWRTLLIPLAFAVTLYLPQSIQLEAILAGSAILIVMAAFGQRAALGRIVHEDVREADPAMATDEWRTVARPIWATLIAGVVFSTLDVITLGFFIEKAAVGWYFAASRTAMLVSFLLMVTNLVVGPEVSRHYYAKEFGKLRRLLKLASLVVFAPSLLGFLICLVFGREIMSVFGQDFVAARWALAILAAGQAVSAAMGCVRIVLNMTGHQRAAARIQITASILTSLGILAGAATFGAIGAAVAVACGVAGTNIWLWSYARFKVRIDPSIIGTLAGQPSPLAPAVER